MTLPTIIPGCVFHWEGFVFEDGEKADKFLVFVGCKEKSNYLAVIATSQQKKRDFVPGCNAKAGYYHIPKSGDGKFKPDRFKKDSWLLIAAPVEMTPAEFLSFAIKKEIELCIELRHDIANAICNCVKDCRDVSDYHKGLLGPARTPPPKK